MKPHGKAPAIISAASTLPLLIVHRSAEVGDGSPSRTTELTVLEGAASRGGSIALEDA